MPSVVPKCRVVITGLGVVHALGLDVETFWGGLKAGRSGLSPNTKFDASDYSCRVVSWMPDFDPTQFMDSKEVKRTDRFVHFAMAAARLAVADAKLDCASLNPWTFGVMVGSGIGGLESVQEQTLRLQERGPRKVSPFMIPSLIANIAGGNIAIEYGARGPNYCTVSACSSASHALGEAMHLIQRGDAEVVISGGSEAAIVEVGMAGFCTMKAMSTAYNDEPTRASRPFDAGRDGFVMGEGAGILILESEAHARARGAHIYGELIGYGASCDAYHITSPDPKGEGLAYCLKRALDTAGVTPGEVDYINAHGTSTPYNDKFETMAVKAVFGDHAYRVPISSTKSMTAHLLGAAGGIEAIACLMAMRDGVIPPTINYETPDPDCDLDYVPNVARHAPVNIAVSNNLGFGGHNATLVFRRWQD